MNGLATGTGDAGGALRTVQSGRVQRYALLLFGRRGALRPSPSSSTNIV